MSEKKEMTREEAIKTFEDILQLSPTLDETGCSVTEAMKVALSALRPVSREQVRKVFPGCEKCRNQANWPSWIEKGFVYCPKCGTPLTSWAWEKQMKRLEALKDGL